MNTYSFDLGARIRIGEAETQDEKINQVLGRSGTVVGYGGNMFDGGSRRPRILQKVYRVVLDGEDDIHVIEEEYLEPLPH